MARNEIALTHRVAKFDGTDFAYWKMRIEDYLYGEELDAPLRDKPDDIDDEVWNKLDRRVLGMIRLRLSKNVVANVAKETTTKGLMKALCDLYEKPSASKVYLMEKLIHLKMSDNTPIAKHLKDLNDLINQLSMWSVDIEDEMQGLILLASLPDSWEPTVAVISNLIGTNKVELQFVKQRLLSIDYTHVGERTNHSAPRKGSSGDFQNRGRSNSRGKSDFYSLVCWSCGETGHIKRHCKARRS